MLQPPKALTGYTVFLWLKHARMCRHKKEPRQSSIRFSTRRDFSHLMDTPAGFDNRVTGLIYFFKDLGASCCIHCNFFFNSNLVVDGWMDGAVNKTLLCGVTRIQAMVYFVTLVNFSYIKSRSKMTPAPEHISTIFNCL